MIDCLDLEDEVTCEYCHAGGGVHCGAGKGCVTLNQRCDGFIDCLNARDELRCCKLTSYEQSIF